MVFYNVAFLPSISAFIVVIIHGVIVVLLLVVVLRQLIRLLHHPWLLHHKRLRWKLIVIRVARLAGRRWRRRNHTGQSSSVLLRWRAVSYTRVLLLRKRWRNPSGHTSPIRR